MKTKLILSFILISSLGFAQQGAGGTPKGFKTNFAEQEFQTITFLQPDVASLNAEDAINDPRGDSPWRFGFNNVVDLNLNNSGTWITLPSGGKIWRLAVRCKNAKTINLTFNDLEIPAGNELYVYNPDKSFILGKFTAEHLYDGQLGTELVPGETSIIEYYVPANNSMGSLTINTVTHGYRSAIEFNEKAFGSSGSCNFNVNCTQGAAWVNERNSAVMLVSGSNGFCSGALINNVLNDGKPYVLTADHCYSNPATWIFRFNWQATACANPASSPTFESLSGGVLRSRATATDFCLVEITGGLVNNTVPAAYTPYFAGWDNTGDIPASAVCIHHPSGDIKKISFENDPLVSTTFGACPPNSHWGILGWDSGVTEPGSSGSPLFDQNHRIIGQLHGGASACGAASLSDEYGKVSVSWNPAGSNSTNQLKFWLDPNNIGAGFINGYDPAGGVAVQIDPGLGNIQGASGTFCTGDVSPSFTLTNGGSIDLTSATITYGYDGNLNLTYNWVGLLAQWQSAVITLPATTLLGGAHTLSVAVSNPNAGVDENLLNNNASSSFNVVINGQTVALDLTLDCYGSEITWELQDAQGAVLFAGGPYQDNASGLTASSWCLGGGCYAYVINDSYGDGLFSGAGCPTDGSVLISQNGDSLTGLATANADFGTQTILNFCVSGVGIEELSFDAVIYPNPANDNITVSLPFEVSGGYDLYDLSGKLLVSKNIPGQQFKINLDTYANGAYFLRVWTDGGNQIIKKIIIE
jgi:hypothetical protein